MDFEAATSGCCRRQWRIIVLKETVLRTRHNPHLAVVVKAETQVHILIAMDRRMILETLLRWEVNRLAMAPLGLLLLTRLWRRERQHDLPLCQDVWQG